MKKIKAIILTVILLCTLLFAGCCDKLSEDGIKDNILNCYNNFLNAFSRFVLTSDFNLQGERSFGTDEYTGNYTADYSDFSGEEYIFGGTSIEREGGTEFEMTFSVSVTSGDIKLYWIEGADEHIITDTEANGTYNFTISPCDNYIIVKGENYTGNLDITIE